MTADFATTFEEAGLRTIVSAVTKDEYIYIEQESTFRDEENELRTEKATVLLNVQQFGEGLAALVRAQVVAMA